MPIHVYRCAKCNTIIEVIEGRNSKGAKCDECSSKMERLITSGSFHLKGTGWYVTDYKNSKGNK